jgi:hypothetical protein
VLDTFTLANPIGTTEPYANNVLVSAGNFIYRTTVNEYFVLENNTLDYTLAAYKSPPYVPTPTDFAIFVNGAQLTYGSGYVIDYSGVTINLRAEAYVEGATLTVAKLAYENYTINGNQINFTTPPTGTVEVISFYNHSVEAIQRETEYTSLSGSLVSGTYDYFRAKHLVGGKFKLSRSVVTDDYVWVIKKQIMLQ